METDTARRRPWSVTAGRAFDAASLRLRLLAARAAPRGAPGPGKRPQLAAVEGPMAEADSLNHWNVERPHWLRRMLRKQGRINRRLRDACEALGGALGDRAASLETLRAREHFWRASQHQHSGFGPALLRRLSRRQWAFNHELSEGLRAVAAEIRVRFPPSGDAQVQESLGHLDWHVAEAAHLNRQGRGLLRLWQRARRDQFMINRCHTVALKLCCALLARF